MGFRTGSPRVRLRRRASQPESNYVLQRTPGTFLVSSELRGPAPLNTALDLMSAPWPFDQPENAAALTTRQVMKEGAPILSVTHYSDDESWAFTCGTTNSEGDAMVVSMRSVFALDPTLALVSDLPPGWRARRIAVGSAWVRTRDHEV